MLSRRDFVLSSFALAAVCAGKEPSLTGRQRVDRVLEGAEVDRPPFTFYYHFRLQDLPGDHHARATLDFHKKFGTDLVKVMSDFPYPKSKRDWFQLEVVENPFPEQIKALELIAEGLSGRNHFIETVFNPWGVAGKLSSKEEVSRLKEENPQALLDALEIIAKSEANHARRTIKAGASGIFLAIGNAQEPELSREDYGRFSEPFDRMVLEAVADAPLNTLHLHGEGVYLDRFYAGWPASVIQYSIHGTGQSYEQTREAYDGVLMGGLDEGSFRTLSSGQLESQWKSAQEEAGRKFILAPGCSVPDETADSELQSLVDLLTA